MNIPSYVNKQATKIYNKFAHDPGSLLLITGTIGWILSSAAHIVSIVVNDKVEKNQKKFLVWQEFADAAVNIASFYIITDRFTKLGKHLVKSGKIATPKIMKFLEDNKLTADIGKKTFDISESNAFKKLNTKDGKAFKEHYFNMEDGVAFIASTTGSIISSNIITPILRNKFAADRQKQSIAEDKQHELGIPKAPVLPAQNRFGIEDYKSKVMATPRVTTGGSMRV